MIKKMKSVSDIFLRTLGDVLPPSEEKQLQKLHSLIHSRDFKAVQAFLKEHPQCDLSKRGDEGYTALQLAVFTRNIDMLMLLLSFDSKGVVGALNLSVEMGYDDVFNTLLAFLKSKEENKEKTSGETGNATLKAGHDPPSARPARSAAKPSLHFNEGFTGKRSLDHNHISPEFPDSDIAPKVRWKKSAEALDFDSVSVDNDDSLPTKGLAVSYIRQPSSIPSTTDSDCTYCTELMKEEDSSFQPHGYEPLIRAAKAGNFRATSCLLKAGFFIPEPHKPCCDCPACCIDRVRDPLDPLRSSHDRLEMYRALSSPMYIMLTARDPILTAIERCNDLKKMSIYSPENMEDYKKLSIQCSTLAVDLLAQCRQSWEVKQLLIQREGSGTKTLKYGRLQLAVRLKQKQFIAHPTCQDVLAVLWLECLPSWRLWSILQKVLHVVFQVILMPFLCFIYVIAPRDKHNRYVSSFCDTTSPNFIPPTTRRPKWVRILRKLVVPVKVPLNRFVYASASYCCFLALLLISIIDNNETKLRMPCTIMWYDWPITVWIIAFVYKLIRDVHWSRSKSFWTSWWILYELLMMGFLIAALICLFVANSYYTFENMSGVEFYERMYPLVLLGEGFYAIGCTLAFMRVLQWLHLSQHLGVIIISFSRMSAVIFRLLFVFIIVLFAFSSGIHVLYKDFQVENVDEKEDEEEKGFFRSYKNTLRALFWAIFGHGESKYADIPDHFQRTLPSNDTFLVNRTDYMVTEVVGHLLWGSFHVAFVIVLLNMVIAVMTNNFEEIQENCDVEWKFARTKLWMYYFEDHNAVPPPFNLLYLLRRVIVLVLSTICLFFKTLFSFCCCCCSKRMRKPSDAVDMAEIQVTKGPSDLESSPMNNFDDKYKMLTKELVNRLLHKKNIETSGTIK